MNSDGKFWLLTLALIFTFILLFTLIFVIEGHEEKKIMVEARYEQVWESAGSRVIWRKVRDGNNNTN